MDRQIAFILAGATLMLGFGGYLMTSSMGEYDLDKSAKTEKARVERLSEPEENKGPGLFAALMEKASVKLETARNVYQGEHFPPTPEGWVLKKTHHDEIVDFTVDYKLDLDITDKSSMRRLSGWGGQSMARTTDLAYHKGDKVIFMRLAFANKPIKKPLSNVHSWLFNGRFTKGDDIVLAGATFETRHYEGHELINIASETGHYTGIGIFTNASMAEVESLLDGMDLYAFASQTGNPDAGSSVVPFLKGSKGGLKPVSMISTDDAELAKSDDLEVVRRPKASPTGNMLDGLDAQEEDVDMAEETAKPKKKRKNLLSSLLGGDDDEVAIRINRKKKSGNKSGGSFQKVGNFTSRCQSGGGAKICRVDN
ncbi:hypothetical protein [Amylibacter sp. IMCC11727]|uniref:hypothetical protein n=1 Tax=Amylibacter sp. IMCC11727 TaxID=3039851 RepID=UPI00244DDFB2|nr:hypothetical protein [Amylibacter sp. IMCC11727]WGI21576.1 hypothetical protein QBD29_15895 [Amylibacter sp. IMCC11727]